MDSEDDDYFQFLLQIEAKHTVNDYFATNSKINPKMRKMVVEWLMEVTVEYKCSWYCFIKAIKLLDIFLCIITDITPDEMQLIGITTFWIATKIDEIYGPALDEMSYITDRSCSRDMIKDMESKCLDSIEWRTCISTSLDFALYYARTDDPKLKNIITYILCLATMDQTLITERPSRIGKTAVDFAHKLIDENYVVDNDNMEIINKMNVLYDNGKIYDDLYRSFTDDVRSIKCTNII